MTVLERSARPNTTLGVLNGPNLNLLDEREPGRYGTDTLDDVRQLCEETAAELGFEVDFRRTNHEGVLVDHVHDLRSSVAVRRLAAAVRPNEIGVARAVAHA